ncbi:MAG: SprB repeat-containing protein [Saprospiraceae bacterium]
MWRTNRSIDLTAMGGTMPYTFLWSNGEITEDLSDVLPGDYDVTVTGDDGCSNTGSYTVNDDLINIEITGTPTANTACVDGNGSIILDITPVGTYTYEWSNGETTQDLSDLLPGNFEVTVTASGNCSSIASFQIADNPELPTITNVVTASICGQPDGAIDISPTGGIAPYTYEWSNGELTEDLINILSGTYSVTVTDAVGCSVAGNFNVANNSNTFTMDASTTANTLCAGANGSVDLQITPIGTYTIIWSNGATTEDLTDVASGTYSVTVTDSGTCSASGTYVVDNDAPTVNVSGTATDILCFGENTGEISVNATGGVEPYQYDWSPAIPGSPSDPTGLIAGDYTVIVTDASGCTGEVNFTINQPTDAVQLACSQTVTVSGPGMTDGEAAVNIMGGTAPYSISWTPGGSQDNVPSGNFTIDNLAEGVYDVVVVDANGCEMACGFTINANGCEDLLATIAMPEPITCIDPQVELVGSSSLPNSSFAWSTLNGQIVGNTNTATIVVNEAGDYTLIVGSNGCFDTAFVNVIDLTADLTANITATPTEILDCTIDAINLMGSVIGTTSANYVWSLNNQDISTNQTITVDGEARMF